MIAISFKYSMGVNDSISFKFIMVYLSIACVNDSISFKYSWVSMIALVFNV